MQIQVDKSYTIEAQIPIVYEIDLTIEVYDSDQDLDSNKMSHELVRTEHRVLYFGDKNMGMLVEVCRLLDSMRRCFLSSYPEECLVNQYEYWGNFSGLLQGVWESLDTTKGVVDVGYSDALLADYTITAYVDGKAYGVDIQID